MTFNLKKKLSQPKIMPKTVLARTMTTDTKSELLK